MDQDLVKILEDSGFTEKEAGIYLALLELSRGTVTDISKITKLKRSIIYVILEGLQKRGYASQVPGEKINTYRASDPSSILFSLKKKAKNFSEMLPLFLTLQNQGTNRPKISYFETKEGILNVYEKIGYSKEQFFISSYVRIEETFPGLIERWTSDRKKKHLSFTGRHLVPNETKEKNLAKKFEEVSEEIRVSDDLTDTNMDFTIFDNTLSITSFEKNPFIVTIESEELIKSIKPIFEIAWKNGKPLT